MYEKSIHKAGHVAYITLYALLIVFSVIFYNWANLKTLLYSGWTILAFGILFLVLASQSRKRAAEGKIVDSGLYALVRHPEFLGHMLIIFSLILISQHLISLVMGVVLIVVLCLAMVEEEKRNIEKFGDAYEDYMQRVPRINLLAGILRKTRKFC